MTTPAAMDWVRGTLISGALAMLASCSFAPAIPPSPTLASAPMAGTLKRHLTFMPDDASHQERTLIGLIRLDETELRAALLTPYGQRLVTLMHDAQGSRYEAGDVPQATVRDALPVTAEWLASRLQWGLWPIEALREAFVGSAWSVAIEGAARVIRHHGEIVARITPATTDASRHDTVLLDDRQGQYRLRITPFEEPAS